MNRRTHLEVDPLEGRTLLSGMEYSLTTNQSTYKPGQPIVMTFKETNLSTQPVSVDEGPSIDGFNVTQGGKLIWQSNSGINPFFIEVDTLQPGQSLTLTATWNGVPTGGTTPVTGTFVIDNQLNPVAARATVTVTSSPTSPTSTPPGHSPPQSPTPSPAPPGPGPVAPTSPTSTAPTSPTPTAPTAPTSHDPGTDPPADPPTDPPIDPPASSSSPVTVSIATDHPTDRIGHRVRMTMTVHNDGTSVVDLDPKANGSGFTIFDGSTPVWHSPGTVSMRRARKLEPGHSIKLDAVWNGKSGLADVSLAPGIYTIEATEGGHSSSTTLRITD
jgi:hypothetical protein